MQNNPTFLGEASLRDVIGRPARHGEFLFVAVLLHGTIGKREHHLGDRLEVPCGDGWIEQYEALWVRARIGRVFGVAPPSPLGKGCLLDAAFLAVRRSRRGPYLEAYPFVCTDSDGEEPVDYEWYDDRIGLAFSLPDLPESETRRRIADAFWRLLLAEPDDLATFGDYYSSHYAHYHIECDGRDLYCVEICPSPEDEPDDRYDGFGFGESWVCPDCDGEGIEFLADLIEQTCETCRGSGVVGWVER